MWAKRFGWLALIWAASVAALGVIALLIRLGMGAAGMTADAAAAEIRPADAAGADQMELINYSRSLAVALRASRVPRERAMSTLVSGWDNDDPSLPQERGRVLRAAAQAAPQDVLVQAIWAHVEDEESGCTVQSPCPDRRLAQARLEPDNAMAWIAGFDNLDPVADETRVQELLEKMAASSRADDHYVDSLEAWLELLQSRPTSPPAERTRMDERAAVSYGVGVFPSFGPLFKACKRADLPDAAARRFELCAQAGRVLRDRSETILTSVIGATLVKLGGVANAQDAAALRRLRWLQNNVDPDDANQVENHQYFADTLSTRSELQAMRMSMARRGIAAEPPDAWIAPQEK